MEVVENFDLPRNIEAWKHIKKILPGPGLRCDYLDLYGESMAIWVYVNWVPDAGRVDVLSGLRGKKTFYTDMYNELRLDVLDVYDEYKAKMEEISGRRNYSPVSPGSRVKLFAFRDSSGEPFQWLENNGPLAPIGSS